MKTDDDLLAIFPLSWMLANNKLKFCVTSNWLYIIEGIANVRGFRGELPWLWSKIL